MAYATIEENRRYWQDYYNKYKEEIRARRKINYQKNKERVRDLDLMRLYGITLNDFKAMLVAQNNKCAICLASEPGGHGTWRVDHDHATNRVRGLLCSRCNQGIGYLSDSVEVLQAAINYLKNSAP